MKVFADFATTPDFLQRNPVEYGFTNYHLGDTYRILGMLYNDSTANEYISKSKEAYNNSLQVIDDKNYPNECFKIRSYVVPNTVRENSSFVAKNSISVPNFPSSTSANTTQLVEIKKVWFENNVFENESKGLRVHVKFDTQNLKDDQCVVFVPFYNDLTDEPLNDYSGYYAVEGHVVAYNHFTPAYVKDTFNDFTLFIPYDELHMDVGTAYIKFLVGIGNGNELLARSDWNYFSFTRY